MFADAYQRGLLTLLFSSGSKPLALWGKSVKGGGCVRRVIDEDTKSAVVEILGTNVIGTCITIPCDPKTNLGIGMPFLILVIKNMNKYFSFLMEIVDDTRTKRRFRVSNYQSATRVNAFDCSMPIRLNPGWNQVQFNLADFTRRAYGTSFKECTRVAIHANCRIRRVYFAKRLYKEEELPIAYKLFVPIPTQPNEPTMEISK